MSGRHLPAEDPDKDVTVMHLSQVHLHAGEIFLCFNGFRTNDIILIVVLRTEQNHMVGLKLACASLTGQSTRPLVTCLQ